MSPREDIGFIGRFAFQKHLLEHFSGHYFSRWRPNRVIIEGIEKFRTPFLMIKTLFDNSLKIIIGTKRLNWTLFANRMFFRIKEYIHFFNVLIRMFLRRKPLPLVGDLLRGGMAYRDGHPG